MLLKCKESVIYHNKKPCELAQYRVLSQDNSTVEDRAQGCQVSETASLGFSWIFPSWSKMVVTAASDTSSDRYAQYRKKQVTSLFLEMKTFPEPYRLPFTYHRLG